MNFKSFWQRRTNWFAIIASVTTIIALVTNASASGQPIPWDKIWPEILAILAACGIVMAARSSIEDVKKAVNGHK